MARWSVLAFIAIAAAGTIALVVEQQHTAAEVRTVKVITLPPRPQARFRIVDPQPLPRAQARAAARAAAADMNMDYVDERVQAYALPGKQGAQIIVKHEDVESVCLTAIEPAAGDSPGKWSGTCTGGDRGASHIAGDTYVGIVGPESGTPTYEPPQGRSITLRPNADGLVVIQGAPHGSGVMMGGVTDGITIGRDARHHCSDGTTVDVRADFATRDWDPCTR